MRFFLSLFLGFFLVLGHGQITSSLLEAQLAGANEVVSTVGELEVLNAAAARYTYRMESIVLNEESEVHQIYSWYDPDNKLEAIEAKIMSMDGKQIARLKKADFKDHTAVGGGTMYAESRVKYATLNHSSYPYRIEFTFTRRMSGISLAAFPNWQFQSDGSSFVHASKFTITTSKDIDIQYRMYNMEEEPMISNTGEETTYTWQVEKLPPIENEPWDPYFSYKTPLLRVTPSAFKIDRYEGRMDTWKNYGAFLHQLWDGKTELPEELAQKVRSLTADAAENTEKIARLYQFMQDNKRYVSVQLGIGGWQPFDADYVEERGYGDCKALSNYMKAMLSEIGINSYPVIVSAGNDQPYIVEDDFVDPAFNHAILYVPEEDVWLECTSTNNPVGYLGRFTNNRRVLLVTPDGGQLAHTPHLSVADNLTDETVAITLAATGGATINYASVFKGIDHEFWRNRETYSTEKETRDAVREIGKLPNLELGEVALSTEPLQPVSRLSFTAEAARYASKAGKRLFVPLNVICPNTSAPDVVEERDFPVVVNYGYTEKIAITFTLPEGYVVESIPEAIELDTPYGQYKLEVRPTDNQVVLEREYIFYDKEYPAEEYEAFREFLLQVAKADASKMVLVQS